MQQKTKVILVEDHAAYREGIEIALEDSSSIQLTKQFSTCERALDYLQHLSIETAPTNVLLLDLNLPGMSGIEALPKFKAAAPDLKIIILTQSDSEADVLNAISNGASGYLLKSATAEQIRDSIQVVMQGGASLDSAIAQFILQTLKTRIPKKQSDHHLTERELEVLDLIGKGLLKKEISGSLNISVSTVATHIRHIYEKLEVQNAPAAISKAYRRGLL